MARNRDGLQIALLFDSAEFPAMIKVEARRLRVRQQDVIRLIFVAYLERLPKTERDEFSTMLKRELDPKEQARLRIKRDRTLVRQLESMGS